MLGPLCRGTNEVSGVRNWAGLTSGHSRRSATAASRGCAPGPYQCIELRSVHRPSCGNRPELFDAAGADGDVPVVEVDGGVAMAGDEADLVAEAEAVDGAGDASRPSPSGRRASPHEPTRRMRPGFTASRAERIDGTSGLRSCMRLDAARTSTMPNGNVEMRCWNSMLRSIATKIS